VYFFDKHASSKTPFCFAEVKDNFYLLYANHLFWQMVQSDWLLTAEDFAIVIAL
jgi:hypothetical protein